MQMCKIKFRGLIAAGTRAVRDVTTISGKDGDHDDLFIQQVCLTVCIGHCPFSKRLGSQFSKCEHSWDWSK